MKVILTDKVKTLGNTGDLVNVSPGFARNFLIPNQKAVFADESNKKELDNKKRALAKKMEEEKKAAEDIKGKVEGITLVLTKKIGGSGKLFGTVTNNELSQELAKNDISIEKRQIHIETPIKNIGTFDITAKLFAGVEASFKVKIEMDPKQAEELKKKEAAAKSKKAKKEAAKADASAEDNAETETTEQA